MKLNSRATNLRHLQDALAALTAAAAVVRTSPRPEGYPPPSARGDRATLAAARRAFEVGATPREIAGAALLPVDWARGAGRYGAPGRTTKRSVA